VPKGALAARHVAIDLRKVGVVYRLTVDTTERPKNIAFSTKHKKYFWTFSPD
jgi:hypothetical protein